MRVRPAHCDYWRAEPHPEEWLLIEWPRGQVEPATKAATGADSIITPLYASPRMPAGASKWNPIEHPLFSEISKNWAAEPLGSYEKMLKFIRTTSIQTGLAVTAYLDRNEYPTRLKPDPQLISSLRLTHDQVLPQRRPIGGCGLIHLLTWPHIMQRQAVSSAGSAARSLWRQP